MRLLGRIARVSNHVFFSEIKQIKGILYEPYLLFYQHTDTIAVFDLIIDFCGIKITFILCFLPSVDQAFAEADSIIPFSVKMAGDESGTTLGQPHLARQDLSSLVSDRLTDFTASRFYIGGCRLVALPENGSTESVAGAAPPPPGT